MKFGIMGSLGGWQVLSDFGDFGPHFQGAQIFDCRYLGHFLTNRHKILHG